MCKNSNKSIKLKELERSDGGFNYDINILRRPEGQVNSCLKKKLSNWWDRRLDTIGIS